MQGIRPFCMGLKRRRMVVNVLRDRIRTRVRLPASPPSYIKPRNGMEQVLPSSDWAQATNIVKEYKPELVRVRDRLLAL
jgi:hypothetical protein